MYAYPSYPFCICSYLIRFNFIVIHLMVVLSCMCHYWKRVLCRGPEALPRAKSRALGKDTLCRGPATGALGKERPSAKTGPRQIKSLPRVEALGKDALGKLVTAAISRQALPRATR